MKEIPNIPFANEYELDKAMKIIDIAVKVNPAFKNNRETAIEAIYGMVFALRNKSEGTASTMGIEISVKDEKYTASLHSCLIDDLHKEIFPA